MQELKPTSIVKKPSFIIQTSNEFTRLQRMAFNFMLRNVQDKDVLKEKKIYEIKTSELVDFLGIQKNDQNFNANKYVKRIVGQLAGRSIRINILSKSKEIIEASKMQRDGWDIKEGGKIYLSIFQAIYTDKKGIIRYQFNDYLIDFLYNPNMYSKIKLSMQKNFLTKYSIALYEICFDYIGVGQTPEIRLGDLKKLLLGDKNKKSYNKFFLFNSKVLKPAIENINNDTDILLTLEFIKKGRKVIAVKFRVKLNPGDNKDEKQANIFDAMTDKENKNTQESAVKMLEGLGSYKIPAEENNNTEGATHIKDILKKQLPSNYQNQLNHSSQYEENKQKIEMYVNDILNFTHHEKSKNFYYKIAWAFVLAKKGETIHQAISEVKADFREKEFKKNKAAVFNSIIQKLAQKKGVDLK
jgi:plasmid replication initiation protein